MSIERLECIATIVQDERRLDGSWRLELLAEDDHACTVELRLMLNRDGRLEEGEIELTRGAEPLSGALDEGNAHALTPLELHAVGELNGGSASLSVMQREDGDFDLRLQLGALP